MRVSIYFCSICGYRKQAEALAGELRDRFGADIRLLDGKLGQFDVLVNEQMVASRGEGFLSRMSLCVAPDQEAVISAIKCHLTPTAGEICEIPRAPRANEPEP